jgi:hypothetical protein
LPAVHTCLLLTAGLAALVAGRPAGAEEAPPPGTIATLDLAARLYASALAGDDPLAAVAAFRLAGRVTFRAEADWAKATAEAGADDLSFALPERAVIDAGTPPPPADGSALAGAGREAPGFSALELVTGGMEAAVREMAAGDEDLLALVDDAAAETARGRIGGANSQMSSLGPGRKDVWEIPFAGMERAEIGVFGDGGGGLGWMVADPSGQPVCLTHHSEHPLYCAFTPAENAFYTVTVVSRAEAETRYLLATN